MTTTPAVAPLSADLDKPLPCPFCGHDAELVDHGTGSWRVACLQSKGGCGAQGRMTFDKGVTATAEWNRRAAIAADRAQQAGAAAPSATPYGYHYEWAGCITTEGPQNFKWQFDREAPPLWAIQDGQARSVTPLYTAATPQDQGAGMQVASIAHNHDAMLILTQGYPREDVISVVDAHAARQVEAATAHLRTQLETTTANLQAAVQEAWKANAALSEARAQLARQGHVEPVAWMDPTAGCVMDAFLWQKDAANPQYSVPVYASPAQASAAPADALPAARYEHVHGFADATHVEFEAGREIGHGITFSGKPGCVEYTRQDAEHYVRQGLWKLASAAPCQARAAVPDEQSDFEAHYRNLMRTGKLALREQDFARTPTGNYSHLYVGAYWHGWKNRALAASPEPATAAVPAELKDHNVRQLVNDLAAIGKSFGATQQLRSRVSDAVTQFLGAQFGWKVAAERAAQPVEQPADDARDAALIESEAKKIYSLFEGAKDHPWVEGGNSNKQDEARRLARSAIAFRQASKGATDGAVGGA